MNRQVLSLPLRFPQQHPKGHMAKVLSLIRFVFFFSALLAIASSRKVQLRCLYKQVN